MSNLFTVAQQIEYRNAIKDVFDTFARPFSIYLEAQTANISTSPTYSRFGQHDQNAQIGVDNPVVTPTVYTVTGCIEYGSKQPWIIGAPDAAAIQLKLRESAGVVRIKVEAGGFALLSQAKLVTLDGYSFQMNSVPRPHGIVGSPDRWTFTLDRIE